MQEFATGHKTLKGMWAKSLPDMFHAQNKENLLDTTTKLNETRESQWNCQLYCFPAQRIYLTSLALYAITTFQNDTTDRN